MTEQQEKKVIAISNDLMNDIDTMLWVIKQGIYKGDEKDISVGSYIKSFSNAVDEMKLVVSKSE